MSEVIHVHVYDPTKSLFKSSKSDRAEIHTYACDKASVCDAHKKGKCIMVGNPLGPLCFGRRSNRQGPTRRAKSFRDFLESGKSHEKYRALTTQPSKVFKVGDGYFMPYGHIDIAEESPFEKKGGFFKTGFPFLESPTPEKLSIIYRQRPQAMMGGEIVSYQRDVVPEIVRHLHSEYPELYKMLLSVEPDAEKLVQNFDYTGKKAVLKTLLPGKIVVSKNTWHWDGKYLTGPGSNLIFPPADATEVRITPKDNATIKVSDTTMVGPETVIVD